MKPKINDIVEVVNSHISGVNVGDKGRVACYKDKGVGVELIKVWPPMVSHETIKKPTSRILYFELKQLKIVKNFK